MLGKEGHLNRRLLYRNRILGLLLVASLSVLMAGCLPTSNPSAQQTPGQTQSTPQASQATAGPAAPTGVVAGATPQAPPARAGANPAVRVYDQDSQSVVNITSVALVPNFTGGTQQTPRGIGSGFVIDQQGNILTNNHVVENADQLIVTFKDGATIPGKLVGRDPDNDLAVIQVDPNGTDDKGRAVRDILRPVQLGDSNRIVIGEDSIAIGSPLGLQQTVTAGIVSAIRSPEDPSIAQLQLLGGAIQTDAPINPGNSGGPLFNASAEVIGVNTAILSQSGEFIGIGLAIPINVAKRVAPDLISSGCYRHPLIGVTTVSLSVIGQAARRDLGIPANQKGLLVQEAAGGAAQAGIKGGDRVVTLAGGQQLRLGGDVILAVDGRELTVGGQLRAYIENNKRPGDTVTLTILRGDQRQDVQVPLGERPNDQCR